MSLLTRKRIILAKLEGTYGTDASPTGSDAMLVRNLTITPLNAELVNRDLIRPYLGNSDTLLAQTSSQVEFEIELAGSGVPGVAPGWAPLLMACGFAEDLNTASVTITRSSSTATVTHNSHGFETGTVVKISGAAEPEYNGEFTITKINANSYSYTVSGSPSSPATGSPVAGVDAQYSPISESFDSLTIYANIDGVLHKMTGARGNVEFGINVKQIPVMKFTFTAIYNAPTDTAAATPDFSAFQIPKVANTDNTTSFSLLSFAGYLESVNLNMANDIQYRTLIGHEEVLLVDRKPAGTFVFEAPLMASKNFFEAAKDGDVGTMTITHGVDAGNIVKLDAARVSIQNPSYQDSQGVHMLSVPFVATPDNGDDELLITVK